MNPFLDEAGSRILSGGGITFDEAMRLSDLRGPDILSLIDIANRIKEHFCGLRVDLCSIINARSGGCPEDCAFCAQSSYYSTGCQQHSLLELERLLDGAHNAKKAGATNFCIVTSGRELDDEAFDRVCLAIIKIREEVSIEVDGSLGFISQKRAYELKEAGISRYNHNLETSQDYYSRICSTHQFEDRLRSVRALKTAGITVCCGGIIGMGEEFHHRIRLAFTLKELGVDYLPLNMLNPRPGTPLANVMPLSPMEIIKTIAIFRCILPKTFIKVAGGRQLNLRDLQGLALFAGANGLIIGNYLTTSGGEPQRDLQMIKDLGLSVRELN